MKVWCSGRGGYTWGCGFESHRRVARKYCTKNVVFSKKLFTECFLHPKKGPRQTWFCLLLFAMCASPCATYGKSLYRVFLGSCHVPVALSKQVGSCSDSLHNLTRFFETHVHIPTWVSDFVLFVVKLDNCTCVSLNFLYKSSNSFWNLFLYPCFFLCN